MQGTGRCGGRQYGGGQYGGGQYGGGQYGGRQYGGRRYGGRQYGGRQYGGRRYGRTFSKGWTVLRSHMRLHYYGHYGGTRHRPKYKTSGTIWKIRLPLSPAIL